MDWVKCSIYFESRLISSSSICTRRCFKFTWSADFGLEDLVLYRAVLLGWLLGLVVSVGGPVVRCGRRGFGELIGRERTVVAATV